MEFKFGTKIILIKGRNLLVFFEPVFDCCIGLMNKVKIDTTIGGLLRVLKKAFGIGACFIVEGKKLVALFLDKVLIKIVKNEISCGEALLPVDDFIGLLL